MPEYKMCTTLLHSLADKMFVVIVDQIKKSFNNQIFQVDLEFFFFVVALLSFTVLSVFWGLLSC